MPPGICEVRISASTPVNSLSNCRYFRRTERKCSVIGRNDARSSPVSYGVLRKEATSVSVDGCEVPPANGEMDVSSMSSPPRIAMREVIEAIPEV